MNKSLLLSLAMLCALPTVNARDIQPTKIKGHYSTVNASKNSDIKFASNLNPYRAANGYTATLDESFESEDKTFPEGWSLDLKNENDWIVYCPIFSGITPTDGYYSAMGTCFTTHDGSWLISPEITPKEGEQLMFDLYFDVRALYVWTTEGDDKNIDEEDGLILKRENAENMKICISVDGGEWVELKNLWSEYGVLGYHEILDYYAEPEYRPFTIALDEYVGKKVKIGFCHQYLDERGGYGMFLDAVKVSLPPVKVSYQLPFGSMFWGLDNEFNGMRSTALMPMYTELAWINDNYGEDLSFNWTYSCPSTEETFNSTDEELVSIYTPDYSENPETAITVYSFPTLSATNEAGTTGEYTYADGNAYIFAGAEASLPLRDGGVAQFGLSTFDLADDFMIYNCDFSTPAWGYNSMTKDWWTNHFFRGMQEEGDCVEVTANINFFYSSGAPIVVDGVRVAASTECEDDAEFKLQLIELTDEFVPETVLAEATVMGADLINIDPSYAPYPNTAILNFKFDSPVVIDGKNFIARLSGFNSEKVTYYATIQSYEPSTLCYGYVALDITAPSIEQYDTREQLMPATLDDYAGSFAMFLDARIPWLVCEDSEFEAADGNNVKVFEFDSSYPAEELTVADENGKLPEWLKIEKSGRYGNTKVTVTVPNGSENNEVANLTVSAPGVSKSLTIKRGNWTSSISDIYGDKAEITETQWFDLTGRRLTSEPVNGAYILKNIHSDGSSTVEKIIK